MSGTAPGWDYDEGGWGVFKYHEANDHYECMEKDEVLKRINAHEGLVQERDRLREALRVCIGAFEVRSTVKGQSTNQDSHAYDAARYALDASGGKG